MNEKSRTIVGTCTDAAAASGVTTSKATRAIAPSRAMPVRSSCRNGSPPPTMPA